MQSFLENIRARPHRVWEAILLVLGAGGIVLMPEAEAAVQGIIGLLIATGVIGGEVAQTKTTSLANPRDSDGTSLVRVDEI